MVQPSALSVRSADTVSVMDAIIQPFIGGGGAVLAHFLGVKFRMRVEDDVDLLYAEGIATAGDGAEVMRVEDVFHDDSEAGLPLFGDAS